MSDPSLIERLTEIQIKHLANRFLCWRLPDHFDPDAGISFKPYHPLQTPGSALWPVGTNLFSADQAEAMVRFMAEDLPATTVDDATVDISRELDITNADHIAVWLEANTILDEPMSQCISWLACRIVEAHEAAISALPAQGEIEREEIISAWAFAHNIDGAARNDLFKRLKSVGDRP